MGLLGRTRELGLLRGALDRPTPSLIRVYGLRGVGKSALVERISADYGHAWVRCAPVAAGEQRARVAAVLSSRSGTVAPADTWADVFATAAGLADPGAAPFVLIIDDAHRLTQARARPEKDLVEALGRAAKDDRSLHVVLVSHEPHRLPEAARKALASLPVGTLDLRLPPLTLRAAVPLLPGKTPRDFVRAYAAFGGIPRILEALDRSVTVGTAIRRAYLEPDSPLAEAGAAYLERDVQSPIRYYAVMRALSGGEADWSTVHAGISDLTSSGQVAPYLQRLTDLGLIAVRRSLDASPRSRSRRYRAADPFFAFWFRFVLPRMFEPEVDSTNYLNNSIRPFRAEHTSGVFAEVCRQFMEHDAIELFGANARESGSLWGPGHEIDAGGILGTGAAYYGHAYWSDVEAAADPVRAIDDQVRETRYGFGREGRLRILFAARPLPRSVEREVARRHDVFAVGAAEITGVEERT